MSEDAEKPRRGWEIRSLLFVMKTSAILLFAAYLLLTLTLSWTWVNERGRKPEPVEHVVALTDQALQTGRAQDLLSWLGRRPPAELDRILSLIEARTGELPSFVFLGYSNQSRALGRKDEALFWQQYARYRIRFDALRCGSTAGPEKMQEAVELFSKIYFKEIVPETEAQNKKVIQRVLDYDARYPARNQPQEVCRIIQQMTGTDFAPVSENTWAAIRHGLRIVAEKYVESPDQAPPDAKQEAQ